MITASTMAFGQITPAFANPQGGVVVGGSATITESGNKLDVHQHTDRAVIDWRSFDIDVDEHTQFHQPSSSSLAVNRVNSSDKSNIMGRLSANGNIVIINQNGVLFGGNSRVDVNSLVATTADISNADAMAGNLRFNIPGNPNASIVNEGLITAKEAGLVGFVAPSVENHGIIHARLGRVELASGDTFTVDLYGDGLYEIAISDEVAQQLVGNTGEINAEGGVIALTAAAARDIVDSLIRVEGDLVATSVEEKNGEIILSSSGDVALANATLDVSGKDAGQQGGVIEITGDNIEIVSSSLDASGHSAPNPVLRDSAALTADREVRSEEEFLAHGNRAGGSIKIGGDYLGSGDTARAQTVTIDANTTITNDATHSGDGGRTIVWSDDTTKVSATLSARGGSELGNGGFIETSGKLYLTIGDETSVNTSAAFGNTGLWLLDPQDFNIQAIGGDISGATLTSNLASSDVTILSSGGGTAGNGDIFVNDTVSWSANTLTLTAARDININDVMTATGSAALTMNTATSNGGDTGVAGGRVKVDLDGDGFNGRVDYSASGNLTINSNVHTVITSLGAAGSTTGTDLQGINGALGGYYVLGSNIDASATSGWNAGSGFDPIATFTGEFNGLGHTIDGLRINRTSTNDVGLFGLVSGADISNVGTTNIDFDGSITVGGLASRIDGGTTITHSYSTGDADGVAGFAGNNGGVGGLVGRSYSSIFDSFSGVNATGSDERVGGLVGSNTGTIRDSFATGDVHSDTITVGGLVGIHVGSIINSYATGNVTGNSSRVGGLVGVSFGSITESYATGTAGGPAGVDNVGGLVGFNNNGSITNSYASTTVSGDSGIGGLVGGFVNGGATMTNSYAIGSVTGNSNVGGLIGSGSSTNVSNSFWDTQTTGQASSYGGAGAIGRTTAQMQTASNFTDAGWDLNGIWTFHPTVNGGYPVLRDFFTEVDITLLQSTTKTYGDANPTLSLGTDYSISGCTGCLSFGFGAAMTANTNAGTYNYGNGSTEGTSNLFAATLNSGTLSDYIINYNYGNGSLNTTVNQAVLTVTANSASREYGDANPSLTGSITGYKLSDDINDIDTAPTYSTAATQSSNVGSYSITGSGGVDTNYSFSYVGGDLTVNKATVTASLVNNALTRIAGQTNPEFELAYSGFKLGDSASNLDIAPLATTLATIGSGVGVYDITIGGGSDSNYTIEYSNSTGTLTVTPKPITSLPGSVTNVAQVIANRVRVITSEFFGQRNRAPRITRASVASNSAGARFATNRVIAQQAANVGAGAVLKQPTQLVKANKRAISYYPSSPQVAPGGPPPRTEPAPRMTMFGGLAIVEPELVAYLGLDRASDAQKEQLGLAVLGEDDEDE